MRGRKKEENSYSEVISIRLTKDQKEVLIRNKWIKEEAIKQFRDYINIYLDPENARK